MRSMAIKSYLDNIMRGEMIRNFQEGRSETSVARLWNRQNSSCAWKALQTIGAAVRNVHDDRPTKRMPTYVRYIVLQSRRDHYLSVDNIAQQMNTTME